jgi:hypothetical protein
MGPFVLSHSMATKALAWLIWFQIGGPNSITITEYSGSTQPSRPRIHFTFFPPLNPGMDVYRNQREWRTRTIKWNSSLRPRILGSKKSKKLRRQFIPPFVQDLRAHSHSGEFTYIESVRKRSIPFQALLTGTGQQHDLPVRGAGQEPSATSAGKQGSQMVEEAHYAACYHQTVKYATNQILSSTLHRASTPLSSTTATCPDSLWAQLFTTACFDGPWMRLMTCRNATPASSDEGLRRTPFKNKTRRIRDFLDGR